MILVLEWQEQSLDQAAVFGFARHEDWAVFPAIQQGFEAIHAQIGLLFLRAMASGAALQQNRANDVGEHAWLERVGAGRVGCRRPGSSLKQRAQRLRRIAGEEVAPMSDRGAEVAGDDQ